MIDFGRTLRTAREAKGYTVAQVAEITRLAPTAVEALENEDFSGIAAPIYGRGFVKLYCEAVGLSPKPLVDEFMEIYSGNRDTEIKERPSAPVPAAEPAARSETVEPAYEPPAAEPPPMPFEIPSAPAPDPSPAVGAAPAPEPDLFSAPPTERNGAAPARFSRYATPIDQTRIPSSPFTIPPAVWRLGALAAVALVVLLVLLFGARALYRATTVPAEGQEGAPAEVAPAEAKAPAAPKAAQAAPVKREQQTIPALYID